IPPLRLGNLLRLLVCRLIGDSLPVRETTHSLRLPPP
ncbi:hypothetical protein CVE36_08170, partial [Pseudomonas syringae pv. actinidiae]|nr:hypothetical protein [Pseudomonas syringae pv. actinidiae]